MHNNSKHTRWRLVPSSSASFVILLLFVVITLIIYSRQFITLSAVFKMSQSLYPTLNAPLETTVVDGTSGSDILQFPTRKGMNKVHGDTPPKYLNMFNASEENTTEKNSINLNKCVPLKTTKGNTPICVYDPRIDKFVSGSIIRGGMWEKNDVYTVASFLEDNSNMQLLDIGCNIGVFTLQAAKMGRKVIAIDANKFNLRLLSKSLRLGGLRSNVTLLWNAVSDVHETMKLTINKGNIGGAFVTPELFQESKLDKQHSKQTILSVTLEDLIRFFSGVPLFIKMDIEGSEWRALKGGEQFFQQVDVRYVLMEWMKLKHGDNARDVIRHMTSFDFQPYAVNKKLGRVLAVEKSQKWPTNILWVKNSSK